MGVNQNKGYEIKERIGKGGCGSVYLAQKEKNTNAIKKINDLLRMKLNIIKKY